MCFGNDLVSVNVKTLKLQICLKKNTILLLSKHVTFQISCKESNNKNLEKKEKLEKQKLNNMGD